MKKINIIKESREFDKIIHTEKALKYKDYIIYLYIDDKITNYKFGLSVGKKVGNAVTRNKIKRQLKSIIDKKDYQNNFKCIIIVGKGIKKKSYIDMQKNLYEAFEKLNIIKEK